MSEQASDGDVTDVDVQERLSSGASSPHGEVTDPGRVPGFYTRL